MNLVDALVLKNLKGVGDVTVTKLMDYACSNGISTLEDLAAAGSSNLPLSRPPDNLIQFINSGFFDDTRHEIQESLARWDQEGITTLHKYSPKYPIRLLELSDPPPFLFCKGNLDLLENSKAIAVVGTRNNTSKGKVITEKTVQAFHRFQFVIVSGLALGIDTIAHKSALECGAPTVAVLVDLAKVSPSQNKGLANEILNNGGLLVAENQPDTPTIAALFAKRDRIQAGLSTSTFAIETSKGGGTMHAVKAAGKLSRPVFVPDPIAARYSDLSEEAIQGTQYLIENGLARAYTSHSYESISNELQGVANRISNDQQESIN